MNLLRLRHAHGLALQAIYVWLRSTFESPYKYLDTFNGPIGPISSLLLGDPTNMQDANFGRLWLSSHM